MVEAITTGLIIFLLIVGFVIYLVWKNNKNFAIWFAEVLRLAPYSGFTQERIDAFEEAEFWDDFISEYSAEEALKNYLARH